MVSSLSRGNREAVLHAAAIEALAVEVRRPIEEVERTYFAELHRLEEGALVHDYIALFTARRTRALLTEH